MNHRALALSLLSAACIVGASLLGVFSTLPGTMQTVSSVAAVLVLVAVVAFVVALVVSPVERPVVNQRAVVLAFTATGLVVGGCIMFVVFPGAAGPFSTAGFMWGGAIAMLTIAMLMPVHEPPSAFASPKLDGRDSRSSD